MLDNPSSAACTVAALAFQASAAVVLAPQVIVSVPPVARGSTRPWTSLTAPLDPRVVSTTEIVAAEPRLRTDALTVKGPSFDDSLSPAAGVVASPSLA